MPKLCTNFSTCIGSCAHQELSCQHSGKCYLKQNASLISCEENKMRYELNNKERWRIFKFHLDNKIIFSETEKKCDYLLVFKDNKSIVHHVFIELKGQKIATALSQLKETIKKSGLSSYRHVCARIVPKTWPNLTASKHDSREVLRWFQEQGINFRQKSMVLTEEAQLLP